jgi:hypothetical protein
MGDYVRILCAVNHFFPLYLPTWLYSMPGGDKDQLGIGIYRTIPQNRLATELVLAESFYAERVEG